MKTEKTDITDVVLLSPPYDFPPRPSLALAIFKACLSEDGLSSDTLYPMFRMSELLGPDLILAMYEMPPKAMFEEYIFSGLAGLRAKEDDEERNRYVSFICDLKPALERSFVKETILKCVEAAERVTEETAREIVSIAPHVLAVSSVFHQLNGALAVIRRVKELMPEVKTLIGGPNCMDKAGKAILRFFPAVDAVFWGEGDEVFSQTIRALFTGGELPYGCLGRAELKKLTENGKELPYRLTRDMNQMPIPDYSDFMSYLERCPEDLKKYFYMGYSPDRQPVLLIEGSRGCWWGQKKPCSFCGLNGMKNVYRRRSSERIFHELQVQNSRYQTVHFEFTDNVIPTQIIKELLPLIEGSGIKFSFFAEVKPMFSEKEMLALRKAGFVNLQTGIETLNDHLVKLMNKGGDTANNIRFLKCFSKAGIKAYWNMLFRIPGEQKEDYEQMISLLPLLFHLPPPTGYTEICYERRGAYVSHPEDFGMKMVPMDVYRFLYGDNEEAISLLAQHYDDISEEDARMRRETRQYYDPLVQLIRDWCTVWKSENGCHFLMEDRGDFLVMTDTRPCAKKTICFLKGIARRICLICDLPRSFTGLWEELEKEGETVTEEDIKDCLDYLIENLYVVYISGKYLTLAINRSR